MLKSQTQLPTEKKILCPSTDALAPAPALTFFFLPSVNKTQPGNGENAPLYPVGSWRLVSARALVYAVFSRAKIALRGVGFQIGLC